MPTQVAHTCANVLCKETACLFASTPTHALEPLRNKICQTPGHHILSADLAEFVVVRFFGEKCMETLRSLQQVFLLEKEKKKRKRWNPPRTPLTHPIKLFIRSNSSVLRREVHVLHYQVRVHSQSGCIFCAKGIPWQSCDFTGPFFFLLHLGTSLYVLVCVSFA